MKKFLLRLAIFVIVSLSPSYFSDAAGVGNIVGPPVNLPDSLQIGDATTVLTGIVTNQIMTNSMADVYLVYQDSKGTWQSTPSVNGGYTVFPNLQAYKQVLITNGLRLCSLISGLTNYAGGDVWLTSAVDLEYDSLPNGFWFPAVFSTNIGKPAQATSNIIWSAGARTLQPAIRVPGLQVFTVTVDSPQYSYMWSNGVVTTTQSLAFGPPPERTCSNWVILNQWYILGTNKARFSITANGQTKSYTQFGEQLSAPNCKLTMGRTNLLLNVPKGSDAYVESSTNGVNWYPYTNFTSSATNQLNVSTGNTQSNRCAMFRLRCQ